VQSRQTLTEDERALLTYLLKSGNYRLGSVTISASEVIDDLGLDRTRLAQAVYSLSTQGFVRLGKLPRDLGEGLLDQTLAGLDALDIIYLENSVAEPEYLSLRQALTDKAKTLMEHAEPISPLEAAQLFHRRDRVLAQIAQSAKTSKPLQPPETLESELLSLRDRLLPFRKFILWRITEMESKAALVESLYEKRMRMLLLFSQVGLSRLAPAGEVAPDLLQEMEVLKARHLVGELSESDMRRDEDLVWEQISRRMTPQLPSDEAFQRWTKNLEVRLDEIKSLRNRGTLGEHVFQVLSQDLSADIALLTSHIPA